MWQLLAGGCFSQVVQMLWQCYLHKQGSMQLAIFLTQRMQHPAVALEDAET
jgi:hypothetical protein